jgi:molybdopterin-guanine dinucleotide biosynthesis protein A
MSAKPPTRLRKNANPLPISGIILAGGRSTRMGSDKAMLDYGNGPIVQALIGQLIPWCAEVLVVSSRHAESQFGGARIVPDEREGMGPLMGILSGLEASERDRCFVIGCDIPHVSIEALMLLYDAVQDADVAALSVAKGHVEPLYAVYRRTVRTMARKLLDGGERRVQALLQSCNTATVTLPDSGWFANVNTPHDFRSYLECRRDNSNLERTWK